MEAAKVETQRTRARFVLAPQSFPWLVFCSEKSGHRQVFFDISQDRYYAENIPEMCNKLICGCSNGWLILVDLNSKQCFLWNPISSEKVELPSLESMDYDFCALSSPPTDPTCHLLFFNNREKSFLFCQPGDVEFNKQEFERDDNSVISHATAVGKTIYCMTYPLHISGKYTLFTVEFIGQNLQFIQLIKDELPQPIPPEIFRRQRYLIESCGELFFVYKMLFGMFCEEVYGFIVLRMDFSENKWVELKSIGERTIFLSNDRGISCLARNFGIKPNSIYFTRAQDRLLYVFDLENLSISKSLPCPIVSVDSILEWVMI